ncbi:MAG: ABC transporter ATP-binding protein [Candidatus Marinimicrobia bacterium]|nr:ABC transporter ATP-binding protein [Candidatus Neomarinimicrobiota bacterium]
MNNGEFISLLGNNGVGKTTFLRLILNLIKAKNGEILVENINIAHSETWKKYIHAYLDDDFLIDFLTPEEYFEFISSIRNVKTESMYKDLESFQSFLPGSVLRSKKQLGTLSSGNRQKIGILSTFIGAPKYIILDEPFAHLDPGSQNELIKLLQKIELNPETTCLLSSHNLFHLQQFQGRMLLMDNGQIIKNYENTENSRKEIEHFFKKDVS